MKKKQLRYQMIQEKLDEEERITQKQLDQGISEWSNSEPWGIIDQYRTSEDTSLKIKQEEEEKKTS